VSRPEFISSGGQVIPIEMRRRKSTRRLRLSLSLTNSVVLSLPWRCSEREGLDFIEAHREWLEHRLAQVPRVQGIEAWLRSSPRLSVLGESYAVVFRQSAERPTFRLQPAEGVVAFYFPPAPERIALAPVVRRLAKEALVQRTQQLAACHRLEVSGIQVRNQSSRWGSCSSRRTISLNWRLLLIAPELQDYVILHELAHLTEMNHSSCFWALLDRYAPERIAHEADLSAAAPAVLRVQGD